MHKFMAALIVLAPLIAGIALLIMFPWLILVIIVMLGIGALDNANRR